MIGLFLDVFLIAAGPFIGSFITASSRAWPDWKQIATGRSACSECGHRLRPWELIPIASFLLQNGKCRTCSAPIWPLHPVGEVIALIIPVIAVIAFDGGWSLAASLFGWMLLFGALVDLRTFILPDVVTLGLIPPGLLLAWISGGLDRFLDHALATLTGFVSLAVIAWAYRRLRGREGLGLGDAKLLAAGGAWSGLFALSWTVALGAGVTLLAVVIAHFLGQKVRGDMAVPLGPGLAAGCYLAYCLPYLVQAAV